MEKFFQIRREGEKIMFCPPDAAPIQMGDENSIIWIPSFAEFREENPKEWQWGLRVINEGNAASAELQVDGEYVFASLPIPINERGVLFGLDVWINRDGIYGGSCRHYDLSVADLMESLNIKNLEKRLPTASTYYMKNTLNTLRVFDLDGVEMNPVNQIFILDEKEAYEVHRTRIRGRNKWETRSLYIPYGWVWFNSAGPELKPDLEEEPLVTAESVEPPQPAIVQPEKPGLEVTVG